MKNDHLVLAAVRALIPSSWASRGKALDVLPMVSRPLVCQPAGGRRSTQPRLRPREQAVPDKGAHVVPEREQRENRREHEPEAGLHDAVVAVAPERLENP